MKIAAFVTTGLMVSTFFMTGCNHQTQAHAATIGHEDGHIHDGHGHEYEHDHTR